MLVQTFQVIEFVCLFKIKAFEITEPAPTHDESKYNCLSNLYIEKKIGKGQFSEVYRAKCLIDNETVALKKIQVDTGLLFLFRA